MRKQLSSKKRFEIFTRDQFTCQYCGRNAPHVSLVVDHRIPVSNGGENHISNLVTACFDCNAGKGAVEIDEYSAINWNRDICGKCFRDFKPERLWFIGDPLVKSVISVLCLSCLETVLERAKIIEARINAGEPIAWIGGMPVYA